MRNNANIYLTYDCLICWKKLNFANIFQATNQKFGLCEALLRVGDWTHAQELINKFSPNHMISHKPIAAALCHLISYVIDPLYKK